MANKKNGIIYRALSPSGKSYIGQTIYSLNKRKTTHINASNNKKHGAYNYQICQAIRKYKEKIQWSILGEFPVEELDFREQEFIKEFNSFKNGYNATPGGDFNPSRIPEIAKRMGEKTRQRMLGTKASQETRKKLSLLNRGKNNSMYGKKHSREAKKKMSIAASNRIRKTGWNHTDEAKRKMSQAHFGKVLDLETKIKIKNKLFYKTGTKILALKNKKPIMCFCSIKSAGKFLEQSGITKSYWAARTEIKFAIKNNKRRYGYYWSEI